MIGKRRAGSAGKRFIAAILALSFVVTAPPMFGKEKRGATVVVTFRDGHKESGELIAVKPKSILILGPDGKDASFDLSEIGTIRVVRNSKVGQGALTGLLIGAGAGAAGGLVAVGFKDEEDADFNRKMGAFFFGAIGAGIGLIAGAAAGISAGQDLVIDVAGLPENGLRAALSKAAKYARFRDLR